MINGIQVFLSLTVMIVFPSICYMHPLDNQFDHILSSMNINVDPCDNFYEFACGNWKPEAVYSKREKYSQLKSLTNQVYTTINHFMENRNEALDHMYPRQLENLRKYYKVCLEFTEKPISKSSYYLDVLRGIGGFPALESDWKEDNFDWVSMASHLSRLGCRNLLSEIIIPAYPFPFQFYKMDLGIGVRITAETSNRTAVTAYQMNAEEMLKILRLYGVENERSEIIVKEILDFFKKVVQCNSLLNANIESLADLLATGTKSNITDELYRQVFEKYITIAWNITDQKQINEIFETQTDNDKLFIVKVIQQVNSTKKETIANYLSLKLLYLLHGDLELIKKNPRFFCTKQIMDSNKYFTSILYNSTISDEEQQARHHDVSQIMNEIRSSLEIAITDSGWLDNRTVDQAILKIKNIDTYIGQLDGGFLGELILEDTQKLEFCNDYETNLVKLLSFQNNISHFPYKYKNLISNTTKALDLLNSAQVNAFYFVLDNSVYIANGILNSPVYSTDQVAAIKYSRMGYILAHEVSHAFDTIGRLFNAEGNVDNWWSKKSEKEYNSKSKCFKKQLDKIFIVDRSEYMQGNVTVDEALADIIGISIAFDSFQRNSEVDMVYQSLLHKNLTKNQLFFLSFAQLYCVEYSQHKLFDEVEDEHPTDNFRAEAALKHLSIFSENFQCPEGSKMNATTKCRMF